MMISLGQAARLAGVGKTTITRSIKAGKLSATRRDDGSYEIDVAELSRAYKIRVDTPDETGETGHMVHHATVLSRPLETPATPDVTGRLAALDAEVRGLRELLAEVKDSRDQWRAQAERLALTGPGERRSWWRRMVG
jgi:hypothetical protein